MTERSLENNDINDDNLKDIFTEIKTIAENEEVELLNEMKAIKDKKISIHSKKKFRKSF